VFIGHFALGFAAKRAAPRVSLAVLFAAAQLADTLWPALVAVGAEQERIVPGDTPFTPLEFISYPYSHSLVLLVVWGVLFALAYRAALRSSGAPTAASPSGGTLAILAALVVSHWLLDYVTHRPDMPLYPGGPRFGLGLWYSIPATIVVESTLFAIAVWMYARATRPGDAIGRWAFVALVALLAAAYVGNILGGAPPSVSAIWIAGLLGAALTFALSWWADSHREPAR